MTFGEWSLDPAQIGPVILVALLYGLRARRLAAHGRPVPVARRASFAAGILVGLASLVTPIDWLGENRLLWVHMVQHLLLGDLAPLLIVLGLTGPVLRPLLAIRWLRPARALAHPLPALLLWSVDLCLWHVPFMYQAALAHSGIHALEHACFALAGGFMWAAVIEPLPGPVWFGNGWKALYTLAVRGVGTAVSNVFIWDKHVLYPRYVPLDRLAHVAPLTDQRIAGLVMFSEGGIVTALAFAWLFLRWWQEAEIRQRLVERDLDEATAARAARYRRSARAREVERLPR
ncbi:MAG TPA: cytochrome c oxidase assembly protein [Solirubrobacteraceae bacterium]|nr:cytochrome c oxidase assembly protein [Solirubrobacteraceae bacterium]